MAIALKAGLLAYVRTMPMGHSFRLSITNYVYSERRLSSSGTWSTDSIVPQPTGAHHSRRSLPFTCTTQGLRAGVVDACFGRGGSSSGRDETLLVVFRFDRNETLQD